MLNYHELSCLQGFWQPKNRKPHRLWCCMDSILRRWNQSDFLISPNLGRAVSVYDEWKNVFDEAERVSITE
tara:strand:- start:698 stop:910 length:213 start_codon:yes stop_codon:yes gene_type:complete